jgi:hypothetical protein
MSSWSRARASAPSPSSCKEWKPIAADLSKTGSAVTHAGGLKPVVGSWRRFQESVAHALHTCSPEQQGSCRNVRLSSRSARRQVSVNDRFAQLAPGRSSRIRPSRRGLPCRARRAGLHFQRGLCRRARVCRLDAPQVASYKAVVPFSAFLSNHNVWIPTDFRSEITSSSGRSGTSKARSTFLTSSGNARQR